MRIEKELNAKLQKGNQELTDRIEELTRRLKEQANKEDQMLENFQQEIRAQTKLADVYKGNVNFFLIYLLSIFEILEVLK